MDSTILPPQANIAEAFSPARDSARRLRRMVCIGGSAILEVSGEEKCECRKIAQGEICRSNTDFPFWLIGSGKRRTPGKMVEVFEGDVSRWGPHIDRGLEQLGVSECKFRRT